MKEKMTPAETARKALEILDEFGWCKYSIAWNEMNAAMYPGSDYRIGSHCLSGAWGEVVGTVLMCEMQAAYGPLIAAIREQYPEYISRTPVEFPWMIIPMMNDRATEEEVRAILEKVIVNGS